MYSPTSGLLGTLFDLFSKILFTENDLLIRSYLISCPYGRQHQAAYPEGSPSETVSQALLSDTSVCSSEQSEPASSAGSSRTAVSAAGETVSAAGTLLISAAASCSDAASCPVAAAGSAAAAVSGTAFASAAAPCSGAATCFSKVSCSGKRSQNCWRKTLLCICYRHRFPC